MTGGKLRPEEVDRLLRETLRDSPAPGDDEPQLSDMRRAWARARVIEARVEPPPTVASARLRAVLSATAGLLLALGLGLHLAFPPRLVAASLAAQSSTLRAAAQLRRAVAMRCVLDTVDEAGRPRRYQVAWRAPDEARVRLEEPDGGTWLRRVPPIPGGLLAGMPPGPREEEPRLEPARDMLSPDRLEALLDGRPGLRVELDETSGLPVRFEGPWRATCDFSLAASPPLPLVGGAAGADGR